MTMFKRQYAILAVIVVLLGIGIGKAHSAEGKAQSARDRDRAFTVMTLNVGDVGKRVFPVPETAACILAGGRPDILLLQEAPNGKAGARLIAALAYPYGSGAQVKSGKLGGMRVLSVYPIMETREIQLPSHGKGAGALCAVLDIRGERVMACSVHLDEVDPKARNAAREVMFTGWEILTKLGTELFTDTVRTDGVKALTQALAEEAAGMPVILAGDFNTVPGSRTIRHMGEMFEDVLWPGADYFTGTYHKIAFPLNPRIDFIFVSDRLTVDHARVVGQSAGDHYPVAARLRLRS